jgi:NIMA (never in mitosis gene a)-related kinase
MNNYDVQKVVGQGSFGKAILCKRKKDSKLCIIKQISIAKLSKKEAKATEQEATLLARLSHPNIVTFWESFQSNGSLYIVMDYADGGDLDSYLKNYMKNNRGRELPEKQVLTLFIQLCLAIKHIHDRKILHRDLKAQVPVFLSLSKVCFLSNFRIINYRMYL